MSWRVFGGEIADELAAIVRVAFSEFQAQEKIDIKEFTRRHIHRGLSFLEGRLGLVDRPIELFSSLVQENEKTRA